MKRGPDGFPRGVNVNDLRKDVPIVGQARLGPWCITLTILCPCGTTILMVGQPGQRAGCVVCGKVYEMRGMPTLTPQGILSVPLGMGMPAQRPPSADPNGSEE